MMVKKLDKWCDINWIIFICVTSVITGVISAIYWNDMPLGAQGAVFVALIMPFHVLEEWKFPGGLHIFYNVLLGPKDVKKQQIDRFPMSRLTDMITNVGLQWIPLCYLVLSLFTGLSNATALCMMLLCFIEVLAHTGGGILTYFWLRKDGKKTIYHPGFATSWMMFLPAGVYILSHLQNITGSDWLWAIILFVVMMMICIVLTETPLKKWVYKQEKGTFAFEDAKYYEKYPSFWKK
ncbi:MAG: HXXEE domain-containing protein [Erysipelotrichaceae bacterium]|nr:HXXEE domain-containing protein [Erysipelotrichaceae bacterium]